MSPKPTSFCLERLFTNMTAIEQFIRIPIKSCQNIKIHNAFIKEWRSTVFHTILPPRNLMKHSKLISPYRISPAREFANVINYILPPTLHFWKRLYNKLYPLSPFSFSIPSGAQTTGKQLETLSFRAPPPPSLNHLQIDYLKPTHQQLPVFCGKNDWFFKGLLENPISRRASNSRELRHDDGSDINKSQHHAAVHLSLEEQEC